MPVDPEVKMFVQDAVAEAIEKHEAENEENIKKLNTVHDTVIKIDTMLEEVDRHEHSEHHHWVKSTIRKQEAEAKKLTSEAAFWTFAGKLAGNKSFWTFFMRNVST